MFTNKVESTIKCQQCEVQIRNNKSFIKHLQGCHCSKEGGSYVCKYGPNKLCQFLPVEGVNIQDYEDHILRHHLMFVVGNDVTIRNNNAEDEASMSRESKPSVEEDEHKWTIYQSSINLPALLNDPRLNKRQTDFFTKTWGDSFDNHEVQASPHLPTITKKSFSKYLQSTSSRYRRHLRDSSETAKWSGEKPSTTHENSRRDLEKIPKVFMSPNFNLDKVETFNDVFPWSEVGDICDHKKVSRSSKLVQEQLSHHLDVVEVHIAKQIAHKSQAFFHAMTSHDVLQEYLISTSQSVKRLRESIQKIDKTVVSGSLKVLKLSQARANHMALYRKLKLMLTVHQTQPTIQLLLSTNEFVGALDLISTTQEVLSQELYGIHCFKHLGSQLAEMENLIKKMIEAEFIKYTAADLNRPLSDSQPTKQEEQLVAILFGMLRLQKYDFIETFKQETFATLKVVMKQAVIEAVSVLDELQDNDTVTNLADQMRLLNYSQWICLFRRIFTDFIVVLTRAQTFCDIATDVVGVAAGRTKMPSFSSQENSCHEGEATHLHVSVSEEEVDVMVSDLDFVKVKNGIRSMLSAVCDQAHDRSVKVLVARSKDGFLEKLSSTEFMTLSREIENFISQSEKICGRKSPSLRASLHSQASKFIGRFHDERKSKLGLILDNERWKQADVPLEFQQLIDHISQTGQLTLPEKKIDTESKPNDVLLVDGHKFSVVGTVLLLIKMVVEYCEHTETFPSAVSSLLTSLIDLLKTFNSRTCQLILGAGALQLVGLKTISTRNLALASRCLQLVVFYIPKVREHFVSLDCKQQYILHLDQTLKDYEAHIEEINNKLIAIMEEMMRNQLSKWEVKPPVPTNCFRNICKQITKLHEAIADLFPQSQLMRIFTNVNRAFQSLLRGQLQRLGVKDDGGPQHALVMSDLAFFAANYRTLAGLESLTSPMTDVWDKS